MIYRHHPDLLVFSNEPSVNNRANLDLFKIQTMINGPLTGATDKKIVLYFRLTTQTNYSVFKYIYISHVWKWVQDTSLKLSIKVFDIKWIFQLNEINLFVHCVLVVGEQ